jgi:hypothetical protein
MKEIRILIMQKKMNYKGLTVLLGNNLKKIKRREGIVL